MTTETNGTTATTVTAVDARPDDGYEVTLAPGAKAERLTPSGTEARLMPILLADDGRDDIHVRRPSTGAEATMVREGELWEVRWQVAPDDHPHIERGTEVSGIRALRAIGLTLHDLD